MCKKDFMVKEWMVTKMGLSGNGLVCYAWLYAETDKGHQAYTGGYERLANAIGTTAPTAYNVLNKLRDMGLVAFEKYDSISISGQF